MTNAFTSPALGRPEAGSPPTGGGSAYPTNRG
jgi:hypothetical protein